MHLNANVNKILIIENVSYSNSIMRQSIKSKSCTLYVASPFKRAKRKRIAVFSGRLNINPEPSSLVKKSAKANHQMKQ